MSQYFTGINDDECHLNKKYKESTYPLNYIFSIYKYQHTNRCGNIESSLYCDFDIGEQVNKESYITNRHLKASKCHHGKHMPKGMNMEDIYGTPKPCFYQPTNKNVKIYNNTEHKTIKNMDSGIPDMKTYNDKFKC